MNQNVVTAPRTAAPEHAGTPTNPAPRLARPAAKRSATPKIVAAAVALAVIGGTGGWLTYDSAPSNQFQPVSYAGDNPFLSSPVGQDRSDVTPIAAEGEQSGATPAMYTEDPDKPSCDAASLVGQLQADPGKASAWASVLGITADAIPRFAESLTPVTLRANTAVIDYGYRDGAFVPGPAVLAAGTAVFINSYGEPTVKCFSGNPLTRGEASDPGVTVVAPAPRAITTNTFVNVSTGVAVTRPGKPDTTGRGPNPAPSIDLAAKAKDARLASDRARVLATEATNQRVAAEKANKTNADAAAAAKTAFDKNQSQIADIESALTKQLPASLKKGLAKKLAELKTEAAKLEETLKSATEKATQSQKDLDAAKAREENLKKDADDKDKDADDAEKKAGLPPQPQERLVGEEKAIDKDRAFQADPKDQRLVDAAATDPATGAPVEQAPVVEPREPIAQEPVVEPAPIQQGPGTSTGGTTTGGTTTGGTTTGGTTSSGTTSSGTTTGGASTGDTGTADTAPAAGEGSG